MMRLAIGILVAVAVGGYIALCYVGGKDDTADILAEEAHEYLEQYVD